MALWLFKEEPETYSFADLQRDGSTTWTGVANPQAQKNLGSIKKGDRVLFYHTGKEKAVVGIMEVTADPTPDPGDADGKRVAVTVKPVRKLKTPVTLATINPNDEKAADPIVTSTRIAQRFPQDCMWNTQRQTKISIATTGSVMK